MGRDYDELVEHLITALVLTLAHDLATEGRRKRMAGRDYLDDAVALIRRSRPHVLGLLRKSAAERSDQPREHPGRGLPSAAR
jgi:hypothetical protein